MSAPDRISAEDLDPLVLANQRERMIARAQVNSHFLGALHRRLERLTVEDQVGRMLSHVEKLMRYCIDRRGVPRFPIWNVAGNTVSFGIKKGRIRLPNEVQEVAQRYVERDDLHPEHVHDEFSTWHKYSMVVEEDSFTDYGEVMPFVLRYGHLRSGNKPDETPPSAGDDDTSPESLLFAAREMDMFRGIIYTQSRLLRRMRELFLPIRSNASAAFQDAKSGMERLRHVEWSGSAAGSLYPASTPLVAGCSFFASFEAGEVDSFEQFLQEKPIDDIAAHLRSLSAERRVTVARCLKRFFFHDKGEREMDYPMSLSAENIVYKENK